MRGKTLLLICLLAAASVASIPDGAELLIIAADTIVGDGCLQPLVDWRIHKGILTRVVGRTEAGSSSEGIMAFVKAAYQAWVPRPDYVLLVGDPCPTGALYLPTCFDQFSDVYTDCLYGDVDGASEPSYKMEISVGRLPVTTLDEARTAVAKVLSYEMANVGTDSLWFITGCTVVKEDGDEDDSLYWSDSRAAHAHWQTNAYASGDSLSRIRGHDADDVDSVASEGRAFIAYRGQIWGFNWGSPFNSIEPESWTNGIGCPLWWVGHVTR